MLRRDLHAALRFACCVVCSSVVAREGDALVGGGDALIWGGGTLVRGGHTLVRFGDTLVQG